MFVRAKHDRARNRTRVQIVKSVRIGKTVRQKVVRYVGVGHSEADVADLKRLAATIMERLNAPEPPPDQLQLFTPTEYAALAAQVHKAPRPTLPDVTLGEVRETSRLSLGVREAMGAVYSGLGWDDVLGPRRKSANRILRELVMARLSRPESKRATVEALAHRVGITLNLNRVYQTMDYLDEAMIGCIRDMSFTAAQALLEGPVDVLFYDCTTLAFATEREDADDDKDRLLAKGYSKDGKSHRSQVLLALLVAADGLPVGYDLFPGNTWEGKTLEQAIDRLEQRHRLGTVTLVADAAMLSASNKALLRKRGLPFILGYRAKAAPKAVKADILADEGWEPWAGHDAKGKEARDGRCKTVDHDGGRIIVTWSPARARKDAHKREQTIAYLKKMLGGNGNPASVSRRQYARFLDFADSGEVTLDDGKVADAEQWDGLHAVFVHGRDDLGPEAVIAQYHQLWQIEACFRTNKHDLAIRPIHHWTPRRVRAHIAICYMAFCCLQHLRKRLLMLGHPISPRRLRRELDRLQLSILQHAENGERYAMPGPVTTDARRILRCVGLTWNEAPFKLPPARTRKRKKTTTA